MNDNLGGGDLKYRAVIAVESLVSLSEATFKKGKQKNPGLIVIVSSKSMSGILQIFTFNYNWLSCKLNQ